MFELLERGPLMEEAGDAGGGGVAVADATSDFGVDSGASAGGDDGETHDAEFVDPENQQQLAPIDKAEEPVIALVKEGERPVLNGKLSPSGKAAFEAIKALSPRLAQEVVQALFTRDFFLREFPGGKREIAQLKALAEQHGGEQGIADLKSIADQMQEIDRMYEAADPGFIEKITETPEGQASFVGLMVPALQKFEKLAPQQFNYHRMVDFVHFMDTARLPVTFERMADLLNRATAYQKAGNHELAASFFTEVTDTYNKIAGTLDKIYTAANTPPGDPNKPQNPQLDDRAKQLTQREQALQKQEWETAVANQRRQIFSKAWGELTKGRNLTAEQDADIKGFYELGLTSKIRQWQNQAARFFANGDRDGYLREQSAFFQKAIPESLRGAIQKALPGKPGPKAAAVTRSPVSRGTQPERGAVRVAKMPPASDLDPIKTTGEMLSANKAVTKDGRLVQWA